MIAPHLNVMFLPIGSSDPWKNTSSFTKNSVFDSRFLNLQGLARHTAWRKFFESKISSLCLEGISPASFSIVFQLDSFFNLIYWKWLPLGYWKAGRFDKMFSFGNSHPIVKCCSRVSRAPPPHTLPAFPNLYGSCRLTKKIIFKTFLNFADVLRISSVKILRSSRAAWVLKVSIISLKFKITVSPEFPRTFIWRIYTVSACKSVKVKFLAAVIFEIVEFSEITDTSKLTSSENSPSKSQSAFISKMLVRIEINLSSENGFREIANFSFGDLKKTFSDRISY